MRGPGCEYAVEVRDLAVGYGAKTILHDVSFRVRRGEIVAILGGSGCGKSTLLKAVIGLLPVKEGEILIEGESMVSSTPAERRKIQRKCGVAFQGGALFGSDTVGVNIALPMEEYTNLSREEIHRRVREKLHLVDLDGIEDMMPGDLSGGMVKRAAVARALALDPDILFLDEPSAGLDPLNSARLDELIRSLRARLNAAVVIVTHELDSIFAIADRAVFLDRDAGTVIAEGPPAELRDHSPLEKVRIFLNRGHLERKE